MCSKGLPEREFTSIIQVSRIAAVEGLELCSKQHLSGRLEEFGGRPACLAQADLDLFLSLLKDVLQEMIFTLSVFLR